MNAIQLNALSAQMWRDMGTIAEDESMMRRAAKYLRRLVKEMTADPTLMTKDEFFQMLDEAEKGPSKRFDSVEELDQYIRSL